MYELFEFNLGDKVKDTVTPFKGVVIARTEYLNGCIRYQVQPTDLKDGAPQEATSFDEEQLRLVTAKKKKAPAKRTGGDRKDPKSRQDVKPRF